MPAAKTERIGQQGYESFCTHHFEDIYLLQLPMMARHSGV